MPSTTNTPKLNLLRIQEFWQFGDESFNRFIDDADDKLVGIAHLDSRAHWEVWKKETTYALGDIVRWEKLKSHQYAKCISAGTSGTVSPIIDVTGSILDDGTVKWEILSFSEASQNNGTIKIWLNNTRYERGDAVRYGTALYRCNAGHDSLATFELDSSYWQEMFSSLRYWQPLTYYFEGDTAIYDNIIYKCTLSHTSVANFEDTSVTGDNVNWEIIGGVGGAVDWTANTKYRNGQLVLYNNTIYRCNTAHTSSSSFATDTANWDIVCSNIQLWNTNVYYKQNSVVLKDDKLYKCITAHTSSDFNTDSANWLLISGIDIKHEVDGYDIMQGMNVKVTEQGKLIANDLLKDVRATHINDEINSLGIRELTNKEIFNSWVPFTCNPRGGYWNDLTNTDQAAARDSYSFNTDNDAIICDRNNDAFSAFISQDVFAPNFTVNYTIDNRILARVKPSAVDNDDDGIFFILGFMKDANGDYHTLSVIRNGSEDGSHGTKFAIAYDLFSSWIQSAGPTMKVLATNNSLTGHVWDAHSYANIQVQKTSTTITAQTSQINSSSFAVTLTYTLPDTKPGDMTEEQYNNIKYMLENDTKIGFGTESNASAFRLTSASGSINGISVYNTNSATKVYFEDGIRISETPDTTVLKPQEFVYSKINKRLYYVRTRDNIIEVKLNNNVEPWTADTFYVEGSLVEHNNAIYKCTEINFDSYFDSDKWEQVGGKIATKAQVDALFI